jgi:transcriptional regulator GlxA family with amidase domain
MKGKVQVMGNDKNTRNVGIYIFDKVEVLDFAGPFEVFSTASRVRLRQQPDAVQLFNVFTIADSLRTIHASGGLQVLPKYDIRNHPKIDVLVVPGGIVSEELEREKVIDWIARCDRTTTITASVCTGAFLLAKAGLLDGKPATTHWEDIPGLRAMFPHVDVRENARWIDTGKIVSSAGISAGIDMSFHLVERLVDKALAASTARQMEFDWQDLGLSF